MGIAPISAPETAKVSFDKPAVKSIAAPPPVVKAPAPVAVQNVAVAAPQAAYATQSSQARVAVPQRAVAPAPVRAAAPAAPVAAPAPAPARVSASGKGATIAAAAMAQLGVAQDCTRLASNALRAAGINFHSGPAGYLSLGTVVPASQAQAGDLIYYANAGAGMPHVAVYVGGGKAVHGGWNGGTTALQSAYLGSGPTFIRVA
jgi:cell wall-associated NlpC family hydrolase